MDNNVITQTNAGIFHDDTRNAVSILISLTSIRYGVVSFMCRLECFWRHIARCS